MQFFWMWSEPHMKVVLNAQMRMSLNGLIAQIGFLRVFCVNTDNKWQRFLPAVEEKVLETAVQKCFFFPTGRKFAQQVAKPIFHLGLFTSVLYVWLS